MASTRLPLVRLLRSWHRLSIEIQEFFKLLNSTVGSNTESFGSINELRLCVKFYGFYLHRTSITETSIDWELLVNNPDGTIASGVALDGDWRAYDDDEFKLGNDTFTGTSDAAGAIPIVLTFPVGSVRFVFDATLTGSSTTTSLGYSDRLVPRDTTTMEGSGFEVVPDEDYYIPINQAATLHYTVYNESVVQANTVVWYYMASDHQVLSGNISTDANGKLSITVTPATSDYFKLDFFSWLDHLDRGYPYSDYDFISVSDSTDLIRQETDIGVSVVELLQGAPTTVSFTTPDHMNGVKSGRIWVGFYVGDVGLSGDWNENNYNPYHETAYVTFGDDGPNTYMFHSIYAPADSSATPTIMIPDTLPSDAVYTVYVLFISFDLGTGISTVSYDAIMIKIGEGGGGDTNGTSSSKKKDEGFLPGFGVALSIVSMVGVSAIVVRRRRKD